MKRRDFLRNSSLFSLPVFVNGMGVSALTKSKLFNYLNTENDRVLVLIYLSGGNDGLNTIIPMDSYDVLQKVRPDVILPENSLLSIDMNNGLHPSLTGFHNLYNESKLGIIQGVAYPDQNRSHFRSTDIWNTGSGSQTVLTTGWAGRYFQDLHPAYPDGFPNNDFPDPFALTIDYTLSETCQGTATNFSLAIADENSIASVPEGVQGEITNDCYGMEYQYVLDTIAQSNAYGDQILGVYDKGNNLSDKYGEDNRLAQKLKLVARLISGGSKTKIYIINQGGYDTHANQVEGTDSTQGDHSLLLKTLSDAVEAFQDDISLLGYGDKVAGMTYSEFGRRIRSNVSNGTDHGTAAPMFLFGECVTAGIVGSNPEINEDIDGQAGVEMQYDFRSVYASVLMDWFEVSKDKVSEILFDDFQYLPIINACNSPTKTNELAKELNIELFPNPANSSARVQVTLEKGRYSLLIYNTLGSLVHQGFTRDLEGGYHEFSLDLSALNAGQYVLRLAGEMESYTKRFVKI